LSETDPFSDAVFVGRLQKLLPMLGSQQPGEADAARRKLIEHLGQHRLSLLDVAARLREPPMRAPTASFTQGAREMSLERQLMLARQAKDEATQEMLLAGMRIRALEAEMQQYTFDIARISQQQGRATLWALAGWGLAAACLLLLAGPRLLGNAGPPVVRIAPDISIPARRCGNMTLGRNELCGVILIADLRVYYDPNDQSGTRTILLKDEEVAVQAGAEREIMGQAWLPVRTPSGNGWVHANFVGRR
jgi:hypothetical protein